MDWTGSSREFRQFSVAVVLQKDNDTHALLNYAMRLAFYVGLTAIFLMITALVIRLMWNRDEEDQAERATENRRLLSRPLSKKGAAISSSSYGGTSWDLESGSSTTWLSSDEDLYNGKICVICYDNHRNCFFVPCGHCIACRTCAARIVKAESKSCPICRGTVDKIMRLNIL